MNSVLCFQNILSLLLLHLPYDIIVIHLCVLFIFKAYNLKVSVPTLVRPLSLGQLGSLGPSTGLAGPSDFWLRSVSDSSE